MTDTTLLDSLFSLIATHNRGGNNNNSQPQQQQQPSVVHRSADDVSSGRLLRLGLGSTAKKATAATTPHKEERCFVPAPAPAPQADTHINELFFSALLQAQQSGADPNGGWFAEAPTAVASASSGKHLAIMAALKHRLLQVSRETLHDVPLIVAVDGGNDDEDDAQQPAATTNLEALVACAVKMPGTRAALMRFVITASAAAAQQQQVTAPRWDLFRAVLHLAWQQIVSSAQPPQRRRDRDADGNSSAEEALDCHLFTRVLCEQLPGFVVVATTTFESIIKLFAAHVRSARRLFRDYLVHAGSCDTCAQLRVPLQEQQQQQQLAAALVLNAQVVRVTATTTTTSSCNSRWSRLVSAAATPQQQQITEADAVFHGRPQQQSALCSRVSTLVVAARSRFSVVSSSSAARGLAAELFSNSSDLSFFGDAQCAQRAWMNLQAGAAASEEVGLSREFWSNLVTAIERVKGDEREGEDATSIALQNVLLFSPILSDRNDGDCALLLHELQRVHAATADLTTTTTTTTAVLQERALFTAMRLLLRDVTADEQRTTFVRVISALRTIIHEAAASSSRDAGDPLSNLRTIQAALRLISQQRVSSSASKKTCVVLLNCVANCVDLAVARAALRDRSGDSSNVSSEDAVSATSFATLLDGKRFLDLLFAPSAAAAATTTRATATQGDDDDDEVPTTSAASAICAPGGNAGDPSICDLFFSIASRFVSSAAGASPDADATISVAVAQRAAKWARSCLFALGRAVELAHADDNEDKEFPFFFAGDVGNREARVLLQLRHHITAVLKQLAAVEERRLLCCVLLKELLCPTAGSGTLAESLRATVHSLSYGSALSALGEFVVGLLKDAKLAVSDDGADRAAAGFLRELCRELSVHWSAEVKSAVEVLVCV